MFAVKERKRESWSLSLLAMYFGPVGWSDVNTVSTVHRRQLSVQVWATRSARRFYQKGQQIQIKTEKKEQRILRPRFFSKKQKPKWQPNKLEKRLVTNTVF